MKFKVTKSDISCFAVICENAYRIDFATVLFQRWLRSALESLIRKLAGMYKRITNTLTLKLNESEALVLFYSCQFFLEQYPEGPREPRIPNIP